MVLEADGRLRPLDELSLELRELSFLQRISVQAAATRDHAAMLRLIVDETTEVMGAEVCSIYLLDNEGGSLVLQATNGISQEQIGRLRLDIGEGVTGWVALYRQPLAVEDVATDPRFSFVPGVDDRFTSMLSVPAIAADRVVGVMNVQTRARHVFAHGEVEFMRALAGQVAGVIEMSHLHTQVAEQLESSRTLVEMLNEANLRLVRASEIHSQFTRLVLADRGVDAIAQTLANLVGWPVVVEGLTLQPLATARPRDDAGRWRDWEPEGGPVDRAEAQALMERVARSPRPTTLPSMEARGPRLRTVQAVVAGRQVFGSVSVLHDDEWRERDEGPTAIEQAATVLAIEFLKQKVAFEVEQRLRGDFFDMLVSSEDDADLARVRAQAGYLGLDLARQHIVALAEPAGPSAPGVDLRRLQEVAASELRDGAGMAVLKQDAVALLIALPDASSARANPATELHRALEAALGTRVRVALGDPFAELRGARVSFRQSRHVLDAMRRCGRDGATSPRELGAYQILLSVQDERQLGEFARRELGPLLDYDAAHGSELTDTLEALIRHNGSLKAAAGDLFVHVNTLSYRLGKIRQLLGDVDDADRRASLYLALMIRRMEQDGAAPAR